jgi:hypothetical protein
MGWRVVEESVRTPMLLLLWLWLWVWLRVRLLQLL